jgi:hypothetical protein
MFMFVLVVALLVLYQLSMSFVLLRESRSYWREQPLAVVLKAFLGPALLAIILPVAFLSWCLGWFCGYFLHTIGNAFRHGYQRGQGAA